MFLFCTFLFHSNLLHLACYFLFRPSVNVLNNRLWVNVLSFLISYISTNKYIQHDYKIAILYIFIC